MKKPYRKAKPKTVEWAGRGAGTRHQIQMAARELLARSQQPVTLQAVAQAAGRPRTGLLFHYPAGMAQLVAVLAVEDYERLRATLASVKPRKSDPRRAATTVFDHLVGLGKVAAAEISAAWEWPPEVELTVNRTRSAAIGEAIRISGSETGGRAAFLLAADAFADVLHERFPKEQARLRLIEAAGRLERVV